MFDLKQQDKTSEDAFTALEAMSWRNQSWVGITARRTVPRALSRLSGKYTSARKETL
jgi:hypothetical protein